MLGYSILQLSKKYAARMNLPIHLERNSSESLQDQLFEQLRVMIVTGKLKPNTRVIGTRFLAEQTGVSRTTVLLAYERLIAEGYLETRPAVGTYVCTDLPDDPIVKEEVGLSQEHILRQSSLRPPVFYGRCATLPPASEAFPFDFRDSPSVSPLLLKSWLRTSQRMLEYYSDGFMRYPPPAGLEPLRSAIADWLAARRGLAVSRDQVIVVAGCQQAYNIAGRLLLREGDRVVVENRAPTNVLHLFESMGAKLVHAPVDEEGIDVASLPDGDVTLACLTPSHQNPLGSTLSLERRGQIIEWARRSRTYLIEDDCSSEFRYQGSAPSPLLSIDPYGLVFYVGTFSKTLGAGLRQGYLIVPPEFIDTAVALKSLLDNGCPWLEQMILADFISSGEYDIHLRRLRKTYLERRDLLIDALTRQFGACHLVGTEGGTHLTWMLPAGLPPAYAICTAARQRGVFIEALPDGLADFSMTESGLMLGYSMLNDRKLHEGIEHLANVLETLKTTSLKA